MIINKEIEVKITKQNISHYQELGYSIDLKDIINVPIEHLQKNSNRKIRVKCDNCGKESFLSYKLYLRNYNKYNFYSCLSCSKIKNEKTCLKKYGVKHPMLNDEVKDKMINTKINRYGDKNFNNIEKIKITCNNKYGSNSSFESSLILEKIKRTNNEKYQNDYYFGSKKFKSEIKDIFIQKYGVDNPSKSKDIQINKLKKLYFFLNIIDIDMDNKKYFIKCDVCNEIYEIPFLILHQRTKIYETAPCTLCNPINSFSNSGYEIQLQDHIRNNYNETILNNDRKILKEEIDIYLPDLKLGFEFNGLYWHSELYKHKIYHLKKTELAEKQGIRLIHIYEDDWIYKQEIVKSRILNLLNKTPVKIYARKCEVKEVSDNKLVRDFLENNHIQGFVGSRIKIGLFYSGELVSLMTFGSLRKAMGQKGEEGTYEMLRFCNKLNTSVVGGASRLFKFFVKKYNPKEMTSYADRSWSQGDLYRNLGFEFVGKTDPNYYYIIDGVRKHRFGFRKDQLVKEGFDPLKTEHEIMLERKIYRIYDSGNLKFEYSKMEKSDIF